MALYLENILLHVHNDLKVSKKLKKLQRILQKGKVNLGTQG